MANVPMQKEKLITIIVPAYNEEENIVPLYEKLLNETNKFTGYIWELLYINDGSTDQTKNRLEELRERNQDNNEKSGFGKETTPQIEVSFISLKKNQGKTEALRQGIQKAQGEIIITLDADLQDDPKYIKDFLQEVEKPNVDFVVGNRTNKYAKNFAKKVSSWIANATANILIGSPINDMNCGFKAMTMECAKAITLKSDYHRYLPLLASIEGFRVTQVNIEQKERFSGESKYGKMGFGRFVNSLLDMLSIYFVYRFRKEPFRLFGRVGLVTFIVGILILTYLAIGWVFGHYIYGRPLFFLGILLSILGTNILGMGLLGEIMVMNKKE
ncbi:glycosyltransferase [Patescibacteria group bacterium]|nr:glycosyltransferase [Patescibacteria group bacterium]